MGITPAHQTPAVAHLHAKAAGGMRSAPRKRRASKKASPTRKRKSAGKKKGKLVKGSAAAKAYMAKIRKKRTKKA